MANREKLLEIRGLQKHFPIEAGLFRRTIGHIKAVDGVSFFIQKGETLGLVGESGCGKTTPGRVIAALYKPTAGQVAFYRDGEELDIFQLKRKELKRYRREVQLVFQDPFSSLNPWMRVLEIVGEPLIVQLKTRGRALRDRVHELLKAVGLRPEYVDRFPHEFSGGQRQRISLARALALNPQLLIADEPVSALDVSVQAQILNLMIQLQKEFNLSYLFIAHDLSVVRYISDRVAVMYLGHIVETGNSEEVFRYPRHPYTEALASAFPSPDPDEEESRIVLSGDVPSPANPPSGCPFHTRCIYVKDNCKETIPELVEVSPDRFVSCLRTEELSLEGKVISKPPWLSQEAET